MSNVVTVGQNQDKKTRLNLKKLKSSKLMKLLILVIFLGLILLGLHVVTGKGKPVDRNTVYKAIESDDCAKGMTYIKDQQPNPHYVKDSIELLKYRAYCKVVLRQYDKALEDYILLKSYYLKDHNTKLANATDQDITDTKSLVASPPSRTPDEPLDPETKQAIEELRSR